MTIIDRQKRHILAESTHSANGLYRFLMRSRRLAIVQLHLRRLN